VQESNLNYRTIPANFLLGPKLLNDLVDLGTYRHALGINFKPGGLQRLCGLPISEIRNMEVDAASVLGNEINVVSQQLKEAKSVEEMLCIVSTFLLKRLQRSKYQLSAFENAVSLQQKSNGCLSIKELSHLAGISMRQFERKSLEKLGMSPKLYSRLIRFSNAYIAKEINPQLKWLDITYQYGYADQMHLIDDFKIFSGYTPSTIDNILPGSINLIGALATSNEK